MTLKSNKRPSWFFCSFSFISEQGCFAVWRLEQQDGWSNEECVNAGNLADDGGKREDSSYSMGEQKVGDVWREGG